MTIPKLHVEIKWGEGVPNTVRGRAMLALERHLREMTGLWIEVFNETRPDDSRLRVMMTEEERARL